jgi:hypothetical protein
MPPPYLRLKKMLLFASAASPPRLDGLRLQVAGAGSALGWLAGCWLRLLSFQLLPTANRLAGADVNISEANFAELK